MMKAWSTRKGVVLGMLCRLHDHGGGSYRRAGRCIECLTEYATRQRTSRAAASKRWQARNGHKLAANCAERRAKRLRATPPWVDRKMLQAVYAEAKRTSHATGIIHEVDHIIPLVHEKVSGLHVLANLRVVPRSVNRAKRNNFMVV